VRKVRIKSALRAGQRNKVTLQGRGRAGGGASIMISN
jgi:hypothetical protein